jgi:hypothetical protein
VSTRLIYLPSTFQILRQRVSNNAQIPFDKDILIKVINIEQSSWPWSVGKRIEI